MVVHRTHADIRVRKQLSAMKIADLLKTKNLNYVVAEKANSNFTE